MATTSPAKKLIPVALPPGCAKLATRPSLTGSSPTWKTIGIVAVAALAAERSGGVAGGDDSNTAADEISHERRQTIVAALQPVVLDRHVLALEIAGFLEALTKRGTILRRAFRRAGVDYSHHRHSRLLRTRRERPARYAAEERDELAPFQLIELHVLPLAGECMTA